jgi:hypothetical protein
MQDLKTEDARQDGGYARRRIARGSVVLVRGDEEGQTVTWVARVDKVWWAGGQPGRATAPRRGPLRAAAAACLPSLPSAPKTGPATTAAAAMPAPPAAAVQAAR